MEENDLTLYRTSIKSIQLQNFFLFSLTAVTSGLVYKLCGGFTPNEKSPWLRKLRHGAVVLLPAILIPANITAFYPGENQKNILDLS